MCLDHLGADVVQKYIGREPSGRNFNEIVLDHNGILQKNEIIGINLNVKVSLTIP